jgi:hypothetical protein
MSIIFVNSAVIPTLQTPGRRSSESLFTFKPLPLFLVEYPTLLRSSAFRSHRTLLPNLKKLCSLNLKIKNRTGRGTGTAKSHLITSKPDLLAHMSSNSGLASQLTFAQSVLGDWHVIDKQVEEIRHNYG